MTRTPRVARVHGSCPACHRRAHRSRADRRYHHHQSRSRRDVSVILHVFDGRHHSALTRRHSACADHASSTASSQGWPHLLMSGAPPLYIHVASLRAWAHPRPLSTREMHVLIFDLAPYSNSHSNLRPSSAFLSVTGGGRMRRGRGSLPRLFSFLPHVLVLLLVDGSRTGR